MNSMSEKCNELKTKYDTCFNSWFSDHFLKNSETTEDICQPLFKVYQECLKEAMNGHNLSFKELEKEFDLDPRKKSST